MIKFMGLTRRNLLIFFKNKQSVLFSMMTSIIVFGLYLLFIKGTYTDALDSVVNANLGLESLITDSDISDYANLVMLVGVLGSAMITVPFYCLTTVVRDREKKVDYDISATPVKRWQIVLSYFLASAVSSVIMTGIILTAGLLILKASGGLYITGKSLMAAYGTVVLGSLSGTAFFMVIVLLFKNSSSLGAFFGILSAAAGFVIGAYIPVSQFSESIRTLCNLFPGSHVTTLIRNALLNDVLDKMDRQIGGLDKGMFVGTIKDLFSFKASMFGHELDIHKMVLYTLGCFCLCICLMIVVYNKTYKRK